MADFIWRGTREELLDRLRSLGEILTGQDSSFMAAYQKQGNRLGNAFVRKAQHNFVMKSIPGGVGDDGLPAWKALALSTIKKRQAAPPQGRAAVIKYLNELIAQIRVKFGIPGPQAAALASQSTPLLHDKGELFAAFEPGHDDEPRNSRNQEIDPIPGQVTVKIKVPKKCTHHKGHPPHLPARPFWAYQGMSEAWWQELLKSYGEGVPDVIRQVLER